MATKVTFTDRKSGKPASLILGSRSAAESYAKTVKNAVLTDVETAAPVVEVKKCDPGTAEAQKAATEAFYAPIVAARRGTVISITGEALAAEQQAEQMMEHFSQARARGQSNEDAMADWNYRQGQ